MGLKSFFTNLFEPADNPMPESLGKNKSDKQNTSAQKSDNLHLDPKDAEPAKDELQPDKPEDNQASAEEKGEIGEKKEAVYNLIILDESGSMECVRSQTISGCNETLNNIRGIAKDQPDIKQFVSIFCFDTTNSRYLLQDVPIEETRDLTAEDYHPYSCTPLYDAIGYTVTQLQRLIEKTEHVAVVTIITDGLENASRQWNHHAVVELIESLKKKGWVFTFIGANIDVERTAQGLGINSFVKFEQTDEGMHDMFQKEMLSRMAYNEKRKYMRESERYRKMELSECKQVLGSMNTGFFVEKERISPAVISNLAPDEVFVFGSNVLGHHDGGAAQYALQHFGAKYGQAEGLQGRSYAIPVDGNTFDDLQMAVTRFNDFVVGHPELKFMLTAVGSGNAGYTVEQIAPLFSQAYRFGNVYVPREFMPYMPESFSF